MKNLKSNFEIVTSALCNGEEIKLQDRIYLIRDGQLVTKVTRFEVGNKKEPEVIYLKADLNISELISFSNSLSETDILKIVSTLILTSDDTRTEMNKTVGLMKK